MIDYIIIGIIALLFCGACYYIRKEKKKGKKCIGCPYSGQCSQSCSGKKKG